MKTNNQNLTNQFSIPSRESQDGVLSHQVNAGTPNEGLCYLLTLSLADALESAEKSRFAEKRRELIEELAAAGLRGARSKMKDISNAMEGLFTEEVEPALNRSRGEGGLSGTDQDWVSLLEETEGCFPIELSVRENHLHLLLRWSGETSLDAQVKDWKNRFPSTHWEEGFYSIQVPETKIRQYIMLVRADQSGDTLKFQQKNTAVVHESGTDSGFHHITVLLQETVDALQPGPGRIIVDATLGGGGHTELLLERGATVIGIDQDPEARNAAAKRLERFKSNLRILSGNFRDTETLLRHEGITRVDGLLADIGVSSHQINTPERGFSFRENGPLDMRMSPDISLTAADIVNTADEAELTRIFREYGEEKASRSLARLIVQARDKSPVRTTAELAALAERAIPRRSGHHPGTKIFQALRITVNDELGALNDLLDSSVRILAPGGRLAVITFHSLEDRCVKKFLEAKSRPEIDRPEWPAPRRNPEYHFNLINRKPVTASPEEIKVNPRSRSAKLRAAQKIN